MINKLKVFFRSLVGSIQIDNTVNADGLKSGIGSSVEVIRIFAWRWKGFEIHTSTL